MFEGLSSPDTSPFSTLRRLAREATRSVEEHCDLCGEAIGQEHRHLMSLSSRELLCACRACAILFDQPAAGAGARRLVPTRRLCLAGFDMTDAQWEGLRIPVNMAFFTYHTAAGRMMAFYPGPMGPTESLLDLETWTDLEQRNPALTELAPDVEALLVNRVRGAEEYFLVPIDECYRLVGLIRVHWKGLGGGPEVWKGINGFFAGLQERSVRVGGTDA